MSSRGASRSEAGSSEFQFRIMCYYNFKKDQLHKIPEHFDAWGTFLNSHVKTEIRITSEVTVWLVQIELALEPEFPCTPEPVGCNYSPERLPYSAVMTYDTNTPLSEEEFRTADHMWRSMHCKDLHRVITECMNLVCKEYTAIPRHTFDRMVTSLGKNPKQVRQCFDRRNTAVKNQLQHVSQGLLQWRVYNWDDFRARFGSDNFEDPRLQWHDFMVTVPKVPYIAMKPVSGKEAAKRNDYVGWMVSARRHLHHNMTCMILSSKIEAHKVGVVGTASKESKMFTVWGDFGDSAHGSMAVWLAKVQSHGFQNLLTQGQQAQETRCKPIQMTSFWKVGRRFCVASAAHDGGYLRLHSNMPCGMLPRGLNAGDLVYVIILRDMHQLQFAYTSLSRGFRNMMNGDVMGLPRAAFKTLVGGTFGEATPLTRQLFSDTKPELQLQPESDEPHGLVLNDEQQKVAKEIMGKINTKHPLLAIWSPPGAGKSVILAWTVAKWQQSRENGANSLALVVTGRNHHKHELRAIFSQFVKPSSCLILESHADEEADEADSRGFMTEKVLEEQQKAFAGAHSELERLDKEINDISPAVTMAQEDEYVKLVGLHAQRLRTQYVDVMWEEKTVARDWAAKELQIVVATSDKMRSALSGRPWWARGPRAKDGVVVRR